MTLLKNLAVTVAAGVVLLILSYRISSFHQYELAEVAAYVTAVGGLTMLVGVSGQISIGHGAFMFIGAYVAALLLSHLKWPVWLLIIAAAAACAVAGGIVGLAAARLRGPYLAGATLMLAVALPEIAGRYQGVFGGDQGLDINITVPSALGANFQLTQWLAWVSCLAALVTLFLLANLVHSRLGRSWRAVRDDEVAAALSGLNVARLQVLAFVVSAACAGVGGALLALVLANVSPGTFTLTLSIALLTAAVLGGLGSLAGALWGTLLFVFLPSFLTNLAQSHGLNSSASSSVPIAAYGVVLIVVMLVFPAGIQGAVRRLLGIAAPAAGAPLNVLRRQPPALDPKENSTTELVGSAPPEKGKGTT
jgi:branched-chain amino acid transport system permease protein